MGRRKYSLSPPRRLQSLPPDLRRPLSQLEDPKERPAFPPRLHSPQSPQRYQESKQFALKFQFPLEKKEFRFINPNDDQSEEVEEASVFEQDDDEPVPRKPEIVMNGKNNEKIVAFDID